MTEGVTLENINFKVAYQADTSFDYGGTGTISGTVSTASKDTCLLYTSPSPRDAHESRMPSSA